MEQVSTFTSIKIADLKYLFFIVTMNNFADAITEALNKVVDTFGEELGLDGKVVKSYPKAVRNTYEEVKNKPWPAICLKLLEREEDTVLLVLDEDFDKFDPTQHQWAIVPFSPSQSNPKYLIPLLFKQLVQKVKQGENIFSYLQLIPGTLISNQASGSFFHDTEDLPNLIAQDESELLEFKVAACWNNYTKSKANDMIENVVKSVTGFMNKKGGLLVISVDNTHAVIGLDDDYRVANINKQTRDGYELFLRNKINNSLGADCVSFYDIIFREFQGKDICLIKVTPASKPFYFDGKLYVRNGNQTSSLKVQEAVEYVKQRWNWLVLKNEY